jgi:hypothetical protein
MISIESTDEWAALSSMLREDEYTIYHMQYDYKHPEGFKVTFWASGKPEIIAVTHNEAVQDAMANYRA